MPAPKTITYSAVPTLKERKLKNKALSYDEKNFLGILNYPFWVTLHYRLQRGRKFKRGESSLKNLSIKGSTGLFFWFLMPQLLPCLTYGDSWHLFSLAQAPPVFGTCPLLAPSKSILPFFFKKLDEFSKEANAQNC